MLATPEPATPGLLIPEHLPERDLALIQAAREAFARAVGRDLPLPPGPTPAPYHPITCGRLTAAALARLIEGWPARPRPTLLVAGHVPPEQAERLRAAGIPFIDAAGNAYLEGPGLLIHIVGRKPPPDAVGDAPRKVRAFAGTGLQVLFPLLCEPEYIHRPYREIARAAGVALGTVGWVLTDLKALDYLRDLGRGRKRLRRRKELLDQWITHYIQQFRPRLKARRFRAADPDWWQGADIRQYGACWGGDVAATKLTGYLKPAGVTVWCHRDPAPLLQAQRMRADPAGDVEVLEAFWHFAEDAETAPPLLVYADLLGTGDPRAIETAKLIYDEHIARLAGED